ncbi:hypothetical protein BDZ89DRAFT_504554 [Hymenopellis radicata]|nr:hypothetical protein BDZ89DRAFT_504554 [Hymenopellis radicata]
MSCRRSVWPRWKRCWRKLGRCDEGLGFYPTLNLADTVQMTNGGSGPYKGKILMVTSGRAELPPSESFSR